MIESRELPERILACFPAFEERWNEESLFWPAAGISPTACGILAELSGLIAEHLMRKEIAGIPAVFALMEQLLVDGTEEVRDAAATCFLENLHNRVPEKIDPQSFVPFLGPQSREYCRAWDQFCGTTTEGL
jgi:hypothetical protein